MAKATQKPRFPSKPCPKCGDLIHARSKSHEKCGWTMGSAARVTAPGRKRGRRGRKPAVAAQSSAITLSDIEAVKSVIDRLGADKVRQLAQVLAK
jgi:hypothetical protein